MYLFQRLLISKFSNWAEIAQVMPRVSLEELWQAKASMDVV
jgi:hypothetical protein